MGQLRAYYVSNWLESLTAFSVLYIICWDPLSYCDTEVALVGYGTYLIGRDHNLLLLCETQLANQKSQKWKIPQWDDKKSFLDPEMKITSLRL
jgi:hypothetical protein